MTGTVAEQVDTALIPMHVHVPDSDLADLRTRLALTRWPEAETTIGWAQGIPLANTRELCAYWADDYDWRATEDRLNALPQFHTTIDGLDIHFIHLRSPHPGAMPLLITHGWPGSVIELLDIIEPLTNPENPADAFHVVCPSLPGYGFSGKPSSPGWDVARIARAWATLMDRLGYPRYAAHGGDWGSYVSTALGLAEESHLIGIHLTQPVAPRPEESVELSDLDQQRVATAAATWRTDSGYASIQATRPQTLGYGLTDSPAGLLAWLAEKFLLWADHDGGTSSISRDRILDSVSLHWFAATGASSARLYWESFQKTSSDQVHVPTGCSIFPKNSWMPEAWCRRRFTDLRYWHDLDSGGGHFPALEAPEVLVHELRTFFGSLR